ncbi:MAG TPA: tagaturonate epimerase family protein [Verrucomicrobiae bacterium]|nr:tagaturonate epimerase family protein [Verrucomicrobiae bacterium]
MLTLGKFSLGMGDRFAQQAVAQLRACVMAREKGSDIVPVWNKSNREHVTIGSEPASARAAADAAVKALGWNGEYHVDADHINLTTVDRFIEPSDFFTIDVASFIAKPPGRDAFDGFIRRHAELIDRITIPGVSAPFEISRGELERMAGKYLLAIQEAKRVYQRIASRKGAGTFINEVSIDETDSPQTPAELLVILAAISDAGIPVQTIAPKFTGRFNKGVDYVGDLAQFEKEFNDDIAVIAYAIQRYGLPQNLKLSVHSGSDKFSIYPPIRRAIQRTGAGLHLKTAGTTWLEELIGLAEAGGEGLDLAQEIYAEALEHAEELCAPYAAVIDIRQDRLPPSSAVRAWTSEQFTSALRHDPKNKSFSPDVRQLLHVGYKIAAKKGGRYLDLVKANEKVVSRNVTENLYKRHIEPLFLAK